MNTGPIDKKRAITLTNCIKSNVASLWPSSVTDYCARCCKCTHQQRESGPYPITPVDEIQEVVHVYSCDGCGSIKSQRIDAAENLAVD